MDIIPWNIQPVKVFLPLSRLVTGNPPGRRSPTCRSGPKETGILARNTRQPRNRRTRNSPESAAKSAWPLYGDQPFPAIVPTVSPPYRLYPQTPPLQQVNLKVGKRNPLGSRQGRTGLSTRGASTAAIGLSRLRHSFYVCTQSNRSQSSPGPWPPPPASQLVETESP